MEPPDQIRIGNLTCTVIKAGYWLTDGGATFGVLPKTLWQNFAEADHRNRIRLSLNTLLIQDNKINVLIDTGLGDLVTERVRRFYEPSAFLLPDTLKNLGLKDNDIDFVILTHLHLDHAGGLLSGSEDNRRLSFPKAKFLIQVKEWQMARQPGEADRASYDFNLNLSPLSETDNLQLVDGDYFLTPEIKLELTGGHSHGMQVVRLESDNTLAYYPGDIIPTEVHRRLAVTSAFDINRERTIEIKQKILRELEQRQGYLILDHQEQAIHKIC